MALRFGLLGTGYWAQEVHGAALADHHDVELTGVWGRNPSKAEGLAGRLGVPAFTELDALLGAVDAVAVALPPDVQAELAVRAATAGCHLLLDKPLALSSEAARRVVEAVDAGGVASLLFFTLRYDPDVASWLDQARQAGDWHGAQATWFGSIFHQGSPFAESAWRRSKGALWDVGPHALALALPTLGPVERLTAGRGLGDTVHLVLGHRGGRSSTLSLSLTVPAAATATAFALWGPRGHAPMPAAGATPLEAYAEAVRQLVAVVAAGGTSHPCDVRFGAEVVAVLEAAERFLAAPADARSALVAG
jgi:predicted dehydrogenase